MIKYVSSLKMLLIITKKAELKVSDQLLTG